MPFVSFNFEVDFSFDTTNEIVSFNINQCNICTESLNMNIDLECWAPTSDPTAISTNASTASNTFVSRYKQTSREAVTDACGRPLSDGNLCNVHRRDCFAVGNLFNPTHCVLCFDNLSMCENFRTHNLRFRNSLYFFILETPVASTKYA